MQILSDLHLEFVATDRNFEVPDVGADVVVLAGDIHKHTHGIQWAAQALRSRGQRVVYVAGNHACYTAHVYGLVPEMRRAALLRRVDFLENSGVVINGIRLLGSTLWTDFQLHGPGEIAAGAMRAAKRRMNDFRLIRSGNGEDFTPAESVRLHRAARAWLEEQLATPFEGPTVVITHHAPHPGSIHERFKGSQLSPAFASDLTTLIERHQPHLWLHGHMHDSCDYQVGNTRVLCNPRGYFPDQLNPGFDSGLVIEI